MLCVDINKPIPGPSPFRRNVDISERLKADTLSRFPVSEIMKLSTTEKGASSNGSVFVKREDSGFWIPEKLKTDT